MVVGPTLVDYGRSAPVSVRVLAGAQYLVGLGLLCVAGLVVAVYVGRQPPYVSAEWLRGVGLPVAALWASTGMFLVVMGRKLHRGRQWARVFALAVSAVALSVTLWDGLEGTGTRTNVLLGLVCPVAYLVLLNTPAARAWYQRRGY